MIRTVARNSPLAMAQAEEVRRLLPQEDLSFRFFASAGDLDKTTSLRTLGKSDLFTRELDELVLSGEADAAVHSAKDLPDPLPQGLAIAAITAGVDGRDCLVVNEGKLLEEMKSPLIATSSERREAAVKVLCPSARFRDLRGTIQERLAELERVDGVVVAEAALIRLGLTRLNRYFLPGTTAEGQGRLAITARAGDARILAVFRPLDARGTPRPWTVLHTGLDPILRSARFGILTASSHVKPGRSQYSCSASRGRVLHYPVIRTEPILSGQNEVKRLWDEAAHILFTSKEAVRFLPQGLSWKGKTVFAIGEGTAAVLREAGVCPIVAPEATQEGMIGLLPNVPILWPRSKKARDVLEKAYPLLRPVDLYNTAPHRPGAPVPLDEVDEIVFMSPSCVEGFLRIYGALPADKQLSAHGPVTERAIAAVPFFKA